MSIEWIEITEVEEARRYSLHEVALAAGMADALAETMVDVGFIVPLDAGPGAAVFSGRAVALARLALRLAHDFELDPHAAILSARLAARIDELERQLRQWQRRLDSY